MTQKQKILNVAVIVAALGYLVDIYDLVLFTIVRVKSLQSLGLSDLDIENKGMLLLNIQMVGMLLGGIFWGILGDKKGRLSVLFGSIVMYSIANILNGMAPTTELALLIMSWCIAQRSLIVKKWCTNTKELLLYFDNSEESLALNKC